MSSSCVVRDEKGVSGKPYGTFSKADWKKIKQSLASIHVDLHKAKISAHFEARSAGIYQYSARNNPWLSAVLSAGPPWPLDEVPQRLAYFYTLSEPKTPKQWAKKLERALAATEEARTALHKVRLAPINYPDNAMRSEAGSRSTPDEIYVEINEFVNLRELDSQAAPSFTS